MVAISVNTNVTSLVAQKHLNNTQGSLKMSMERLSSGYRINSVRDDAAGFAIAQSLGNQISGIEVGNRNANDGISMLQTMESALNEVVNNLSRMRDLAVQSSSGTYSNSNRADLQVEFAALRSEIDRIANVTAFNGTNILDGSSASVSIQIGANNAANERLTINLTDVRSATLAIGASTVADAANAQTAIDGMDTAIATVRSALTQNGSDQSRFETAIRSNNNAIQNSSAAKSRIMDADFASETANLTKFNILSQAGSSMLAQANQIPQLALSLLGN